MPAVLVKSAADSSAISHDFLEVYGALKALLEEPAPSMPEVEAKFSNTDPLRIHRLVMRGVQKRFARTFSSAFQSLPREEVLRVIGVSERTLQRAQEDDVLDPNASDRLLRLATVTEQAIDVLGTQEAAEAWLAKPAIGLDRNRPIDLLETSEGTELVKTLLKRMDYEVYA
ncbi:antitoxin Xre-like helix-turn-helix domain-containing protein [Niveibacterium terrae]|uniref:type II RES/Xre toxin-antitoxin system antitoxin n=1 Tax=Niveibacterium terrae TaxID=3373598 RepID=UPI003A911DA8